jgi:hypothetical protein
MHLSATRAAATLFVMLAMAYSFGHRVAAKHVDVHRIDAQFLTEVRAQVPAGEKILVDLNVEALRGFMLLFYLGDNAVPLHNLSFARDDRIGEPAVFVLTRAKKQEALEEIGAAQAVMRSPRTGREVTPEDRLTLFRLTYHQPTRGVTAEKVRISPMQAMYRADGPVLR